MVNGTLIVQMVHFGIAYLIMDLIFVRYAVALIEQDDEHVRATQRDIMAREKALAEYENERRLQARAWQQKVNSQKPRLESPKVPQVEVMHDVEICCDRAEAVRVISNMIVERALQ